MPITFQVTDTKAEEIKWSPFEVNSILPREDRMGSNGKNKKETNKYGRLIQGSTQRMSKTQALSCSNNSFVYPAIWAYSKHHHLVIKPDDVWLAICTQFSNYVNGNGEELRDKFVDFQGKKELTVSGGGTLFTADYEDLSQRMTLEIAKNIKDPSVREWIMPDFTTTTPKERMVGAVMLMATMKSYFDYKFELCCNLPGVTLLGEVEDWIKIRERANRLLEFDLEEKLMTKWSQMLFPVLDHLVESAKGNPDLKWWNQIANRFGGGSGPSYVSGWITVFCVFSEKGHWRGDNKKATSFSREATTEWIFVNTNDVPRGYVSVPITVDDNGTIYKTEMFAGHMTASYHGSDNTKVEPSVDWVLYEVLQ